MRFATAIFAILVALAGAFYAGNYLAAGKSTRPKVTAPEILLEARKQTPPPALPPKPKGSTVTKLETKETTVPTPEIVRAATRIGPFGLSGGASRVIVRNRIVREKVPVTTLVAASPAEIAEWNRKVNDARAEYDLALEAKINELSRKREREDRDLVFLQWKELIRDLIIPLLTAVAGLLTALAALRWGRSGVSLTRSSVSTEHPTEIPSASMRSRGAFLSTASRSSNRS